MCSKRELIFLLRTWHFWDNLSSSLYGQMFSQSLYGIFARVCDCVALSRNWPWPAHIHVSLHGICIWTWCYLRWARCSVDCCLLPLLLSENTRLLTNHCGLQIGERRRWTKIWHPCDQFVLGILFVVFRYPGNRLVISHSGCGWLLLSVDHVCWKIFCLTVPNLCLSFHLWMFNHVRKYNRRAVISLPNRSQFCVVIKSRVLNFVQLSTRRQQTPRLTDS